MMMSTSDSRQFIILWCTTCISGFSLIFKLVLDPDATPCPVSASDIWDRLNLQPAPSPACEKKRYNNENFFCQLVPARGAEANQFLEFWSLTKNRLWGCDSEMTKCLK